MSASDLRDADAAARPFSSAVAGKLIGLSIMFCLSAGCCGDQKPFGGLELMELARIIQVVHDSEYEPTETEQSAIAEAWKQRPSDFAVELRERMLLALPESRERAIIGWAWQECPESHIESDAIDAAETLLKDPDYRVRCQGFDLAYRCYKESPAAELRRAIWDYILETYTEPYEHNENEEVNIAYRPTQVIFDFALELRREDIPKLIMLSRCAGGGRYVPSSAVAHGLALLTGKFYAHEEGATSESPNSVWQKVGDRYFLWYEQMAQGSDEDFFLGSLERLMESIGHDSTISRLSYAYICHYLGIEAAFWGVGEKGPWIGVDYVEVGWEKPLPQFESKCKTWWEKARQSLKWDPENRDFETPYRGEFWDIRFRCWFSGS